jgi:hypothetical protein
MPADLALAAGRKAAGALAPGPVTSIDRIRGFGRNSGVYRVAAGGAIYALKQYPERHAGERDRAVIEHDALSFLARHRIAAVPRAFAADAASGYLLLEWIDGGPVEAPETADIAAACAFVRAIHALRGADDAKGQPAAAEACLCGAEIVEQIERRVARLAALGAREPALAAALDGEMRPLFKETASWAEEGYAAAGLAFDRDVDAAAQTLCPSDFGFHNAMRRPSGELVFIDFDYFGWDDPVKLTADFLLHPGMRLREAQKRQFAAEAFDIYGSDPNFRRRLALLYPLFALRWCMILLNEFLPERWANRLNAGTEADWESAKQRQLDRAREWMHSLATNFRRFPYGE